MSPLVTSDEKSYLSTAQATPTNRKPLATTSHTVDQAKARLAADQAHSADRRAHDLAQQAAHARAQADDKQFIAELQAQVAALRASRTADVDALTARVAALELDVEGERERVAVLEQLIDAEPVYDPLKYIGDLRPQFTDKERSEWLRKRLAKLGITCHNFRQYPGWGKASEAKQSRWTARKLALERDLLPALLDEAKEK